MKNLWIFYSFIAMFFITIHSIIHKYILIYNNNNADISLAITFLFTGIISLIYLSFYKEKIKNILKDKNSNIIICLSIFLALIILSINMAVSKAFSFSSNISYCNLIINLNIILVLLFSYILFKERLNKQTMLGILLSLIGLSIVIYYSKEK
tara:strand:+ start:5645 stop:6100 length:456 start_codon:yes stop_codon:yes gene_type:complete